MPVLFDQVTQCFVLLKISLVSATSMNDVGIIGGKRIMDHTLHASITCELQHMHLFLPEIDCGILTFG